MKWIKIKNELPEYDKSVIWYMDDGHMFIDMIDHDNDWENFKLTHESVTGYGLPLDAIITHWMQLPESPTEINTRKG